MKSKIALMVAVVLLMAAPVFAGDCQSEITNFDAQLEAANVSEGAKKEAQYMRDEAEKACNAGKGEEAIGLIDMARTALGLNN